MADWLLILAPVVVLGVVLLVSFAGCEFEVSVPPPTPSLSLAARVPNTLTVEPPGVTFTYTRPSAVVDSQTTSTSAPDGADNVFRVALPLEDGSWTARCAIAVREGGGLADAVSVDFSFMWDQTLGDSVAVFRAEGSPQAPPFRIVVVGLQPD